MNHRRNVGVGENDIRCIRREWQQMLSKSAELLYRLSACHSFMTSLEVMSSSYFDCNDEPNAMNEHERRMWKC